MYTSSMHFNKNNFKKKLEDIRAFYILKGYKMAIKNIPTSDDFYNKAESLFFEAFIALLNNILFKKEDEFSNYISLTESNNIVNLFHQSAEFFLKGKITETSPFLLISGLKCDDFLECYTLDAKDLIEVANKTNNNFINKNISNIFEKYRRLRNKDTHSFSSIQMTNELYNEYFFDFIDIYNLFGKNYFTERLKSFLDLKYEKYMLTTEKNKFIEPIIYRNRYLTLISSFIHHKTIDKKNENEDILAKINKENKKIFLLLSIPKNFIELSHFFCNYCSKMYYAKFEQLSLDEIIDFTKYNIKTIYENENKFICFCCQKEFENDKIILKKCKICSSIDHSKKETKHYDDICISCNIKLTFRNKNYLQYGISNYQGKHPSKYFYQNFKNNFKDDKDYISYINESLTIMNGINDMNIYFKINKGQINLNEMIYSTCTEYSLFYTMLIKKNNLNSNHYLKDIEKLEIYNNHKNTFTAKETIVFAFDMYKDILESIFLYNTEFNKCCEINNLLNKFHRISWENIFTKINYYYEIEVNQSNYLDLINEYFLDDYTYLNIIFDNIMLTKK